MANNLKESSLDNRPITNYTKDNEPHSVIFAPTCCRSRPHHLTLHLSGGAQTCDISSKEPYIISKGPYIHPNEPYIHPKEPYTHPKEPYMHSKEPYIHPKEPYIHSKEPGEDSLSLSPLMQGAVAKASIASISATSRRPCSRSGT